VGTLKYLKTLADLKTPPCDLVEVRVDLLSAKDFKGFPDLIQKIKLPLLLTFRGKIEGGASEWSFRKRLLFLIKYSRYAQAIDLESRYACLAKLEIKTLKRNNVRLILSSHFFKQTPTFQSLNEMALEAFACGADIFKVASFLSSATDEITLHALLGAHKSGSVAVMGMGPLGSSSRIRLGLAGSTLVYGYIDQPLVLGQVPMTTLLKSFNS